MFLPRELFELIASFVDRPSDLLSLSITSKLLYEIVVPNHLQYRLLHCDARRFDLWKALRERPLLANRIRYLEITDEESVTWSNGFGESPIAPTSLFRGLSYGELDEETMDENLTPFVQFLSNLQRFEWTIVSRPSMALLDTLCSTCPDLREFELCIPDDGIETSEADISLLAHCPLWKLTNLTQLSFVDRRFYLELREDYVLIVQNLAQAIASQPCIQDLHIYIMGSDSCDDLNEILRRPFQITVWPDLRRLNIAGYVLSGAEQEFFGSHPGLRTLNLVDRPDDGQGEVDYCSMPRLRALNTLWNPTKRDSNVPTKLVSSLNHLSLLLGEDDIPRFEAPITDEYLLKHVTALKSLTIDTLEPYSCKVARNILRSSMGVERLALNLSNTTIHGPVQDQHEMIDIFKYMPNLTHYYFVDLASWKQPPPAEGDGQEDSESGEEEEEEEKEKEEKEEKDEAIPALQALASAVPTLRFVAVKYSDSSDNFPEWMILERGSNGLYASHKAVPYYGYQEDVDIKRWGGCYNGADKGRGRVY